MPGPAAGISRKVAGIRGPVFGSRAAFVVMKNSDMTRSVLLEQACELLGVSRRTLYYRIRDGRLQTVRTRGGSQRVLLDSIERLLQEERGLRVPDADASDTDPSGKSPAP